MEEKNINKHFSKWKVNVLCEYLENAEIASTKIIEK